MSFEKRLDELGKTVQFAEEIFELSYEKFSQENDVLPNEITVGMLLFRKMIEKMDAVFILLENGSEQPAESIVRDLFENLLYLKFIMNEEKCNERALSYIFSGYKDKFNTVNLVSAKNRDGEMIREYLNSRVPLEELIERKTQLEKAMNKECFRNIKVEWKKLSEIKNGNKKRRVFPKWYNLFQGPKNIRELAKIYNLEPIYYILYSNYSKQVHSTNAFQQVNEMESGMMVLKEIRSNEPSAASANLLLNARSFGEMAIKNYVDFFSLQPKVNLAKWHLENIEMMK
ncbi:DUF5677 domain-containing protein [Bacillus albus]|uniref:DUF5677 domain-containing protein n=1 Tax=Bacillus cereus group TaxID=86661 RepID=UPI0022E71594|nr:DUF5677 domain-containing protein [Bacillus cereus group sp. Bc177]MDA2320272.1 DUF5677 domain-containing protein [Bacillus cereus group sp. Bc177]